VQSLCPGFWLTIKGSTGIRLWVKLLEKTTQEISFLGKIVTGDESWVFAYDPETEQQSSKWHATSSL